MKKIIITSAIFIFVTFLSISFFYYKKISDRLIVDNIHQVSADTIITNYVNNFGNLADSSFFKQFPYKRYLATSPLNNIEQIERHHQLLEKENKNSNLFITLLFNKYLLLYPIDITNKAKLFSDIQLGLM